MTDTQPPTPDLDGIQARHHLIVDPAACGTCWRATFAGQPVEHPECARRAVLLPPPDAPTDEDLADLTDEQKAALPARFHTPVWEGLAVPHSWVCAVCYGDGWTTAWPCRTALQHGEFVFTPEHQADRARQDVPGLIARVRHLEAHAAKAAADLTEMTHCRDNALRALHRDDVDTDIDVEDSIVNALCGPGWDWEDERTPGLIARDVAPAIRPALAKATEQRDTALARVAELEQQLAKYVGVEPTVREELAEMNRRLNAAEQLIPADPADDDIAPRIAPRTLRAALDGDIPRTARQTHDEWLRCSGLHCPNAERYAKAEERGWLSAGMGQWLCPDCRTTPAPARDGR